MCAHVSEWSPFSHTLPPSPHDCTLDPCWKRGHSTVSYFQLLTDSRQSRKRVTSIAANVSLKQRIKWKQYYSTVSSSLDLMWTCSLISRILWNCDFMFMKGDCMYVVSGNKVWYTIAYYCPLPLCSRVCRVPTVVYLSLSPLQTSLQVWIIFLLLDCILDYHYRICKDTIPEDCL